MKQHKNNRIYKSIASHALVVAISTNPYLIYLIGDIYKIIVNDMSVAEMNNSLVTVLSYVSFAALVVSAATFAMYKVKK